MANYAELISQFKDVTGTSEDRAKFYLESADWALQVAISSFYESQADADVSPLDNGRDIETVGPSSDSLSLPANTADKMAKNENASGPFKKSVKPRIATLHNMSQRSSDDEEEGQAFYAGGSERSGQQVLGPPKKKNFKEQLTEIFRMAHDSGVVVDPSSQSSASNSRGDSYQGVGLRLGQTEDDHTMVAERNRRTSSENIEPVVLKLWSQGFSINDGELRPYDEPENREFLESVMKGQIPNELRQIGNIVSVDLEDHRHEDYKKPLVETKSFKGSGHILGSPAPNVGDSSKVIVSRTKKDNNQQRATGQLNVDSSQPTTMLQIRLTDGTRISAQFNLSHTIDDIRRYIITTRPQYENQSFILVTAFPTKALTDNNKTIEESGLSNASLMQRLK